MPDRTTYDKSHYSFKVGEIGRLNFLTAIPVVAGESVSLDLQGVFRLSPLRRNLTVDCMVDLFAFYRPYRHTYGDSWSDFIKDGVDETVTFSTWTLPSGADLRFFGGRIPAGRVLPRWLPSDIWSIWNRFFRPPNDRIDDNDMTSSILNSFWSNGDTRHYGPRCCWPKAPWNVAVPQPDVADRRVALQSSQLDLLDLRRVKARYKTELEREYFGSTYNDILDRVWDATVNIDADQRPELIMRKQTWLSGYDVDGTDEGSLGEFAGKAASVLQFGFPRRYFPEHGTIHVLALFRWPILIDDSVNPILQRAQPSYKWLTGDPEVMMSEPPESVDLSDWFWNLTENDPPGAIPYGMHHRFIPSVIDNKFSQLQGFPFLPASVALSELDSNRGALIPQSAISDWNKLFRDLSQQHWQIQARVNVETQSPVPSVLKSIFAGTR